MSGLCFKVDNRFMYKSAGVDDCEEEAETSKRGEHRTGALSCLHGMCCELAKLTKVHPLFVNHVFLMLDSHCKFTISKV